PVAARPAPVAAAPRPSAPVATAPQPTAQAEPPRPARTHRRPSYQTQGDEGDAVAPARSSGGRHRYPDEGDEAPN
ncbi:MAG TPA: hypothetical protein VG939_21380, partial [Caulobacteraceae bacterium]|nr:hypothetical protein [Caulobacteraceae bacterium]